MGLNHPSIRSFSNSGQDHHHCIVKSLVNWAVIKVKVVRGTKHFELNRLIYISQIMQYPWTCLVSGYLFWQNQVLRRSLEIFDTYYSWAVYLAALSLLHSQYYCIVAQSSPVTQYQSRFLYLPAQALFKVQFSLIWINNIIVG